MVVTMKLALRFAAGVYHSMQLIAGISNNVIQGFTEGWGSAAELQSRRDVQDVFEKLQADAGFGSRSFGATADRNAARAAEAAAPNQSLPNSANAIVQGLKEQWAVQNQSKVPDVVVHVDARGAGAGAAQSIENAARTGVEDAMRKAIKSQWDSQIRSAVEAFPPAPDSHVYQSGG